MPKGFAGIKRLQPPVFGINALKIEARRPGEDIIYPGMGNPDQVIPGHIPAKMLEASRNSRNHRSSALKGITMLRFAVFNRYNKQHGVDPDTEAEAVATTGSEEGLSRLARAIGEPGDVVLTTTPAYPIHPFSVIIGEVRSVPLHTICP